MKIEQIENKKFIGRGKVGKCYELVDGSIFKEFNYYFSLDEIERYKYFLNYKNDSIFFPYDFVYDSEKFYGYISKKALGLTLNDSFCDSNLIDLSKNSINLENDLSFIAHGNIVAYDLH